MPYINSNALMFDRFLLLQNEAIEYEYPKFD